MTAAAKPAIETFTFSGESAGVAGASALRGFRSLVDTAPQGRLFATISTLADTSAKAGEEFEAAAIATLRAETDEAEARLNRGMRLANRLPYFTPGAGFPDCLLVDGTVYSRGNAGVVGAGFFGNDWRVATGSFAWRE